MVYFFGKSGYLSSACQQKFTQEGLKFEIVSRKGEIEFDLETCEHTSSLERIREGSTVVFFSALSKPDACEANPQLAYNINVKNTIKIIDFLIQRSCRVLFCSSDTIFSGGVKVHFEGDRPCPLGMYAQTKSMVEDYFRNEPQFIVMRLSYIFGQGDSFTSYAYSCLRDNRKIEIYEGYLRHAISIDTVLKGILALVSSEFISERFFNFCGDELIDRRRILELCDKAFTNAGYKYVQAPNGYWDARAKSIRLDNQNFKKLIKRH
jgi:dTDP-4-dehydrorhamnose reductase